MSYKRRDFLKTTSAAIAITAVTGKLLGCKSSSMLGSSETTLKEFGLQLYTLRDVMPADPKGVLKQVAAMGYKQIESYNHKELGIFWGMSNIEFKKYLDQIGLTIVSSHYKPDNNFEKIAAEAAQIGIEYLIYPYEGTPFNKNAPEYATMPKTIDDFKKLATDFNRYGETCRKNGLRFAYHNHDYTFSFLEDQIPQDILITNTDKVLVDYEMDVYWVVTAGQDPVTWLRKYPNRFRLGHIKDRKKNTPISEREVSVNVGEGSIDFKKVLNVAKNNGMKYFIVEQEKYEGTTPLAAAKADAEYIKKLKF